jgi:hypothetical protein
MIITVPFVLIKKILLEIFQIGVNAREATIKFCKRLFVLVKFDWHFLKKNKIFININKFF